MKWSSFLQQMKAASTSLCCSLVYTVSSQFCAHCRYAGNFIMCYLRKGSICRYTVLFSLLINPWTFHFSTFHQQVSLGHKSQHSNMSIHVLLLYSAHNLSSILGSCSLLKVDSTFHPSKVSKLCSGSSISKDTQEPRFPAPALSPGSKSI